MTALGFLRRSFEHGVHPAHHKQQTADLPIQRDIYCAAIDAISRLPAPEVPDVLIALLESPREHERAEAAQGLGRLVHVAALPALSCIVRWAIVRGLGTAERWLLSQS